MDQSEKKSGSSNHISTSTTIVENQEVVDRYGSASAEFLKGYSGYDAETGKRFLGHKDIAKHRVNPDYAEQNIKQQAGFNAEINKVSRDNANNIINNSDKRTIRTDDLDGFGKNHPRFDHVELRDGALIESSGSQMKFVDKPKQLLDRIAKGEGGGKNDLSRYQGAKLDLPSEQVELAKEHCRQRSQQCREQAAELEKLGKTKEAERCRQHADNYDRLENDCRDSGMTTEDAVFFREHPEMATALEIAKTAHEAGKEGAKFGIGVGGALSAGFNLFAVAKGDIELDEALCNITADVVKAGLAGYAGTAAATAVKGYMQQSETEIIRQLSKTALPSMIPTLAWDVCRTISRLGSGDIDLGGAIEELGQKGVNAVSGVWGAAAGQALIPVPVVGALIGASISCALTSLCFTDCIFSFREANEAKARYERIKEQSRALCHKYDQYRIDLHNSFESWFYDLEKEVNEALTSMESTDSFEKFEEGSKKMSEILNIKLEYESFEDFEKMLNGD